MNIKALLEKKEDLKSKMKGIVDAAKAENRELTEAEVKNFDELEKSIKDVESTIERMKKIEDMEIKAPKAEDKKELTQEEKDIKAFADIIRNETTATQLTKTDNGVVIPSTIAKKIIDKVAEISPIYARATKYNAKGTLVIPKIDTSTDDVAVEYATEFSELVEKSNKFSSITLTGYLAGSLVKVSKSLLNNSDFNLTQFVIERMAQKLAAFIEKEGINGTTNKISGILGSYDSTNMKVTLGAKSSTTADELIDIQEMIPDTYQANACWIMNRNTRKAIRKLKDGQGNYLLNQIFGKAWDYELLGKPVFCSENVAKLGTASKPVMIYGDISGLAIKVVEEMDIQVLLEKFATQHAIGVCGYAELDAKVENTQKIAVAVTGTTDPAAKE